MVYDRTRARLCHLPREHPCHRQSSKRRSGLIARSGAGGAMSEPMMTPRLFTLPDLERMPSDLPSGPVRYELHHGGLVPLPGHGDTHAAVVGNLITACSSHQWGGRSDIRGQAPGLPAGNAGATNASACLLQAARLALRTASRAISTSPAHDREGRRQRLLAIRGVGFQVSSHQGMQLFHGHCSFSGGWREGGTQASSQESTSTVQVEHGQGGASQRSPSTTMPPPK
jgi:hypothetical protein